MKVFNSWYELETWTDKAIAMYTRVTVLYRGVPSLPVRAIVVYRNEYNTFAVAGCYPLHSLGLHCPNVIQSVRHH